jgi:hypothetical protein
MTDQADTAEEDPAAAKEPEPEKSFWASLPPDCRSLIVTVAGTVTGGVLLVMIGALAVIVTKWFRVDGTIWPWQHGPISAPNALGQVGIGLAISLLVMSFSIRSIRRKQAGTLQHVLLGVYVLFGVESVLVILGLAAGIR